MFSFPANINIDYTNRGFHPATGSLNVGSAIKDMEHGAMTPTRLSHEQRVTAVREKFEADTKDFNTQFQAASEVAVAASKNIDHARRNKALAITALAVTIVGAVGFLCAAAATGMLPLVFCALPFIAFIGPESYVTHQFNKTVSNLKDLINAPSRMYKPQLHLPTYNSGSDLDLKQTRLNAQNALSGKSLAQIASSGYSKDKIVSYALLDRVANLTEETRPAFYTRCVQLIDNYGATVREHEQNQNSISREVTRLSNELHGWSSIQRNNLDSQDRFLRDRRRELQQQDFDRAHGMRVRPNFIEKMNLDAACENHRRQDIEFRRTQEKRTREINAWSRNMNERDYQNFNFAAEMLERQYGELKKSAV